MEKEKGGKAKIIKDVIAKGFTARKAQRAVNAVINSWKFALWCGEPVEVPERNHPVEIAAREAQEEAPKDPAMSITGGSTRFWPVIKGVGG